MNKILRDGDKLFLNSDIDSLEIINGEVIIYINDLDDFKININLLDNSKVLIYDYSTKNVNKEIYISQENNTYLRYVHTFRVDGKYNLKYLVNLNGDNNTNDIFISGVSNGDVVLDIDGKVESKSSDNVLNENIKVLTNKGKCFVAPKLHISALNVLANHNTAISNVRESELFYLASKGIDKKFALALIEDGYVYGYLKKYSSEFYDLIKE